MKERTPAKRYIYKSNELILRSKYDFSLQEQKVLNFVCSKISTPIYVGDVEVVNLPSRKNRTVEFEVKELCDSIGITYSGKNAVDIKDVLKNISDKSYWIKNKDDDSYHIIRWFEDIIYRPIIDGTRGNGHVKVIFHEEIAPHLFYLQRNYTKLDLGDEVSFVHRATPALYDILMSVKFKKQPEYETDFENLLVQLDFDDIVMLKQYKYFNSKVLKPSIKEINENTRLNVTYSSKRTEGKTTIKFLVEEKVI